MNTLLNIQDKLNERKRNFLNFLRTEGLNLDSVNFLRYSVKDLGNSLGLAHETPEDEIDESSLEITRTITTPSTDRYGDIVIPRGCEKSIHKYLNNPQVFFGHKSFGLPIAHTSKLEVLDDKIRAVAKFNEETDEARTVWRFVTKGLMPGTSIGFLPVKAAILGSNKSEEEEEEEREKRRKEKTPEGEKVITFDHWFALKFLEWEMLEWSVVSIPANPDCVEGLTKYISDGVIEGQKIPFSISKSLEPFTLKAKIWSPGFDPIRSNYSGVLMLGQDELEFKDGVPQRLGDVSLTTTTVPNDNPVTVPLLEEGKNFQRKDDENLLLAEMKRHHQLEEEHWKVEEAHNQREEECLQKIYECLEKILAEHDPDAEDPPPPEKMTNEDVQKILEAIKPIQDSHNKLKDKFFSLTGSRV